MSLVLVRGEREEGFWLAVRQAGSPNLYTVKCSFEVVQRRMALACCTTANPRPPGCKLLLSSKSA